MNYDGTVAAFTSNDSGYQISIVQCLINEENWISIGTIPNLTKGVSLSKDGYTLLGNV